MESWNSKGIVCGGFYFTTLPKSCIKRDFKGGKVA